VKLSWRQTFPVWWSFLWRSILFGLLGGIALGAVGGMLAGLLGHPEQGRLYGVFGGYLAGFLVSIVALKLALEKHLPHLKQLPIPDQRLERP
jgi:drug/metabolite transporter superfamily protein YnfA